MYINLEILSKVYSESVACFETDARRMRTVQQEAETFLDFGVISQVSFVLCKTFGGDTEVS